MITSLLRHTALFYDGTEHYLAVAATFAGAARDAGEGVLVRVHAGPEGTSIRLHVRL